MDGSRNAADGAQAVDDSVRRSPLLVEPGWLQEHLDDAGVRIIHMDVSPGSYDRAHIPGAVLWNIYADLRRPDYQLVDPTVIERLVQASGIDADSFVVFTGYAPALGLWLLEAHGHRQVGLLNCSLDTWQAQGRPVTGRAPSPTATTYRLPGANPALRAWREDVERAILDPGTRILDVRSDAEYRGERFWPSGGQQAGGRTGHVPSAVHAPVDGLLDDLGSFRDTPELARVMTAADLSGQTGLITYCTIGGRAATAWFVLTHLLGRSDVRVYDGSWAEWGLDPETPVERT
jgi:thiosulfate/3-mercaptopyruvate sulfurtransferase